MLNNELMQTEVPIYLTDGGLETTLVFLDGYDLPEFAAFPLLENEQGKLRLRKYYDQYLQIARQAGTGFVLETPTWRASTKWGRIIGYRDTDIYTLNMQSVHLMQELRACHQTDSMPILISGQIGPQDDGYDPAVQMSVAEATDYHRHQIMAFKDAGVDMVSAITMTYPDEAIGICNAAAELGIPAVISFTVETDGRLPVEVPLGEAITQVDQSAKTPPAYYMINCAHPDHLHLNRGERWLERIGGVRANASRMSHAELDASETLDDGDPNEFGLLNQDLRGILPNLRVLGGCCGTDHRHVGAIAQHCL